jgi:hypothetical protein
MGIFDLQRLKNGYVFANQCQSILGIFTKDPKYKLTIQEQLKISVSLIYDKLKANQHSLKEV